MNMKCEEDLGNNKVVVKVSWTKRKWASDPKLLIKWQHVEAYIKENYSPPEGMVVGECKDKFKSASNDSKHRESLEWVYDLIPDPKIAQAAAKRKKEKHDRTSMASDLEKIELQLAAASSAEKERKKALAAAEAEKEPVKTKTNISKTRKKTTRKKTTSRKT